MSNFLAVVSLAQYILEYMQRYMNFPITAPRGGRDIYVLRGCINTILNTS